MLLNRLPAWVCSLFAVGMVAILASNASAAPILGKSELAGWVYIDRNNDGHLAFSNEPNPEYVIAGVPISLYTVIGGIESALPIATTASDDFGRYIFANIDPGTYDMKETQPIEYVDGLDTLGSLHGYNSFPVPPSDSPGVMSNNAFSKITLSANVGGDFYNFGERGLAAGYASKRFLLASAPGLNTAAPEPTSLVIALLGGFGCCCFRRTRMA
jgi:hypothetical protein